MVRWFLILMMAVLPLHGWAGATLSVARALNHEAPAHAAAPAQGLAAADPGQADPDCLDHAPTAHHHDAGMPAGDEPGSCTTCPACHACSPAALVSAIAGAASAGFDSLRPDRAHSRFASAEPAPGFKPPIS